MPITTDQLQNLIGQASTTSLTVPAIDSISSAANVLGAANSLLNPLTVVVGTGQVIVGPGSGQLPQVCVLPDPSQAPAYSRICNVTSAFTQTGIANGSSQDRIDLILGKVDDTATPPSATFFYLPGAPGSPPSPQPTTMWPTGGYTQIAAVYVPATKPFNSGNVTLTITLPAADSKSIAPLTTTYVEQYLTNADVWYAPSFDWGVVANRALLKLQLANAPATFRFQDGKSYNIATPIGANISGGLNNIVIAGGGRGSTQLIQAKNSFYATAHLTVVNPTAGDKVFVLLTPPPALSLPAVTVMYTVGSGTATAEAAALANAISLSSAAQGPNAFLQNPVTSLREIVTLTALNAGAQGNPTSVASWTTTATTSGPGATSVLSGAFAATATVTIGGTPALNDVVTAVMTNPFGTPVQVSWAVTAGQSAAAVAQSLAGQINLSAAVVGTSAFLQLAQVSGAVIALTALQPGSAGSLGSSFLVTASTQTGNATTVLAVPTINFFGGGLYGDIFSCQNWNGCTIKDLTIVGAGLAAYGSLSSLTVGGTPANNNTITVTLTYWNASTPFVVTVNYTVSGSPTTAALATALAAQINTSPAVVGTNAFLQSISLPFAGNVFFLFGQTMPMNTHGFTVTATTTGGGATVAPSNFLNAAASGAGVTSAGANISGTAGTGVGGAAISLFSGCTSIEIQNVDISTPYNGVVARDFQTVRLQRCEVANWAGPFAYYCSGPGNAVGGQSNTFGLRTCGANGTGLNPQAIGYCCDGNSASFSIDGGGAAQCNFGSFVLQNSTNVTTTAMNLISLSNCTSDHGGSGQSTPPAAVNGLTAGYDLRCLNFYAIFGPGFGQTGTGGGQITDVELTNCKAGASSGDGFALANCSGIRMTQCSAGKGGQVGYNIYSSATDITWTGCRSYNNSGGGVKLQTGFIGANFSGGVLDVEGNTSPNQPYGIQFNGTNDTNAFVQNNDYVNLVGVVMRGNTAPVSMVSVQATGRLTITTVLGNGSVSATITSPFGSQFTATATVTAGQSPATVATNLANAINASGAVSGNAAFLAQATTGGTNTITLTPLAAVLGTLGNAISTTASATGPIVIFPTALTNFTGGQGGWAPRVSFMKCPPFTPIAGGWNVSPGMLVGAPPFPGTPGTAIQNPLPVDATVRVTHGGSISTVTVTHPDSPNPFAIPAAGTNPYYVRVPAGGSIALTWSTTPSATWVWSWD